MNKSVYFPNFFIIGVPKSGTTSLYNYLNQHPHVFLPKEKEPNTLFYQYIDGEFSGPPDNNIPRKRKTMQQYIKLFKDVGEATAIGESSIYLYSDNARKTISEIASNAKFILILRNPADRAYSNYLHMRRNFEEPVKDFQEALALEEDRKVKGARFFLFYKTKGLYARYLKKYFSTFPQNQFNIVLYEHWKANNQKTLRGILEFLNVNPNITINTQTNFNVSSTARIPAISYFLHKQTPLKSFLEANLQPLLPKSIRYRIWSFLTSFDIKPAPKLDPQIRKELIDYYRQDIFDLQDLIEMDLSHWLN